jgi:hypothetical protein
MRRMRAKKREEFANPSTRKQRQKFEKEQETQREKWRLQKRKEKERLTPEIKKKQNERRRMHYFNKQLKKGKIPRNAKNAVILPSTPRKYVETVVNLIKGATPRKRALFKKCGYFHSEETYKRLARTARVIGRVKTKLRRSKQVDVLLIERNSTSWCPLFQARYV